MDEKEGDLDNFASETVGLLILNELRLTRRDMKAGLMRLEAKVDEVLSNKIKLESSRTETDTKRTKQPNASKSGPSIPLYLNKGRLKNTESSSVDKEEKVNCANDVNALVIKEELVPCTVHVDMTELPSEDEDETEYCNNGIDEEIRQNSDESQDESAIAFSETSQLAATIVENQEGRYQCRICENSYSNRGNLRRHYRQHTGDMRYQCNVCNQKFFRNEYLVRHMRKHIKTTKYGKLNKRPFKCGACKKEFNAATSLREHMRIHRIDKNKLFSCTLCSQKFSREDVYNQHIRKVHLKEKR